MAITDGGVGGIGADFINNETGGIDHNHGQITGGTGGYSFHFGGRGGAGIQFYSAGTLVNETDASIIGGMRGDGSTTAHGEAGVGGIGATPAHR